MLAGNWGTVGGGVLMNSILDMLTLRGLWEMSAGSLNTNLEFWGGGGTEGRHSSLDLLLLYFIQ